VLVRERERERERARARARASAVRVRARYVCLLTHACLRAPRILLCVNACVLARTSRTYAQSHLCVRAYVRFVYGCVLCVPCVLCVCVCVRERKRERERVRARIGVCLRAHARAWPCD
jgi:hypothetical protein